MDTFSNDTFTNVTSLADFRQKKENDFKKNSLKEYFSVLSFNELLAESNDIIAELNVNPLNSDLSSRSTLLLKEFHDRIRDSKNMEVMLGHLCLEAEERLNKLNDETH